MLITDVQVHNIRRIESPSALGESKYRSLLFVSGEGTLSTDHCNLAVAENQCVYLPPSEQVLVRGKMTLIQILFSLPNQAMAQCLGQEPCILPIRNLSAREIVLNMIWECKRESAHCRDAASLGLMRLLFEAIAQQDQNQQDSSEQLQWEVFTDPILRLSVNYIDQHLADDDVLDQICVMVNRNQTQLNYLFKKYTGVTALQWLGQRRLLRSKELLCFSNYTITEIAEMTGFKSIHYFSRYFKKKEFVNPQKFKEKLLPANLF
ncbi:MAG: helix-turn-helix domain-containing protein [Oscillospiraceae bacterium]|jgi:AraC-like DNA-binding protein